MLPSNLWKALISPVEVYGREGKYVFFPYVKGTKRANGRIMWLQKGMIKKTQ